ncbi:MAG: AMP-binding protein [Paracoccus sp. (in: a-proteobacteria)]|uniref:AMP-binding protein n=1 Tax=Paracoccus sp. TaxID=267 RepID=UPI0039E344B4
MDWFRNGGRIGSAGARGQSRDALAALLDCLTRRRAILTGPAIRAGGPQPLVHCRTSGSGGAARTVRRSQSSWIASFRTNRDLFAVTPADCYAVLGEFGPSLPLYATVEALHLGCGLLALGGDGPRAQLRQMTDLGATVLYATPTQLRRFHGAAQALPRIRLVLCGGGKLDPACRALAARLFPNAALHEFYGTAETSFITLADASTPPDSVGRPYPGVSLDLDAQGRIRVASPYLFQGYDDAPSDGIVQDGCVLVGDLGWRDAQGQLYLNGRLSRMITVADRNVFPEAIEAVLLEHAGGRACVALARPDPQRGHAILAVIEGAPDPTLEARLRAACRARLGPHCVPRRMLFLPRLPVLPSGKPDLPALERLA